MSRKGDIKWRDKDVAELRRIIKNFNAKISRVGKRNPDSKPFLPKAITMAELRSKIDTRQDFNRELKSLARFSEKGNEKIVTDKHGVTKTKYERKEIGIKKRVVNAIRKRELNDLGISIQKGTMGQISSQNLRPRTSEPKTDKDWDKLVESLDREIRSRAKEKKAKTYKENYLIAIRDFLGEDGEELYRYIESLDPEHVYKNSISNPILAIAFTSDPLPTADIAESALNEWLEIE